MKFTIKILQLGNDGASESGLAANIFCCDGLKDVSLNEKCQAIGAGQCIKVLVTFQ